MKKAILSLTLTGLTVLLCSLTASADETKGQKIGTMIDKTSSEANKKCEECKEITRNLVEDVEKKAHEVAQKSEEMMQNVKESIQQKKYELHLRTAQQAKARAEKKALDLQARSLRIAQKANEEFLRAEQIAKHIEADKKSYSENARKQHNKQQN
jgi:hypothetical protein